ncbi:hypothetical protein F5887DRAFT_921231 [Amanita rubescens]|nr:hypothetical protein F5887DRAFT_921231 [Amanita rubescens]
MYNGGDHYSPGQGPSSYPTPASSPEVDSEGFPLPPATPRYRSIQLPQRSFVKLQPRLHPLLSYANRPCIVYDSPGTSKRRIRAARTSRMGTRVSHKSAFVTSYRHLPVSPSGRNYDYVTVYDILEAVHCAFREVIWVAEDRCYLDSQRSGRDEIGTALLFGGHPGGLSELSGLCTTRGCPASLRSTLRNVIYLIALAALDIIYYMAPGNQPEVDERQLPAVHVCTAAQTINKAAHFTIHSAHRQDALKLLDRLDELNLGT